MAVYSYHIFYFPFKWKIPGREDLLFSEQVDLDAIPIETAGYWERVQFSQKEEKISFRDETEEREYKEMYAERNYYFDFVHPVLYDEKERQDPILYHYERKEPKEKGRTVTYQIKVKGKTYTLNVDAINLNMYATGIGILSFFLMNQEEGQSKPDDIRMINQYGRRIMPPHYGEVTADPSERGLISEQIAIQGLQGIQSHYAEDFKDYKVTDAWKSARFIKQLIKDLSPQLEVTPVIDDRMFVNCWYGNDELVNKFKASPKVDDPIDQCSNELRDEVKLEHFVEGDFWYKYLFVDDGNDDTCQNKEMRTKLLKEGTYYRWQKSGSLYGVSRYSFVALTDTGEFAQGVLLVHMRTIYSRMIELMLVQRASMLCFSCEVPRVSCLSEKNKAIISRKISSLYKEYIRFVNQIYFREVTAQDQGIELHQMLMKQFDSDKQIKDLDSEISELHNYASLLADQRRNENGHLLNKLAAIFLPATVLAGLFGMNSISHFRSANDLFEGEIYFPHFLSQIALIGILTTIIYVIFIKRK